MSAQQKEKFDLLFKGFIMVALSVIGFFAMRSMNTLDKATSDIEALKISSAVMQNDMTNFKESWKIFLNITNDKQAQHEQERKEDAKK